MVQSADGILSAAGSHWRGFESEWERERIRCHFKKVTPENGLLGLKVEIRSWDLLQSVFQKAVSGGGRGCRDGDGGGEGWRHVVEVESIGHGGGWRTGDQSEDAGERKGV